MRLFIITVILSFLFLFACGQDKEAKEQSANKQEIENQADTGKIEQNEKLAYYTCPMEEHKHIHSNEPGKCPECSMDLVAVIETNEEIKDYYGCTMAADSHVRHDKSGKCEECGMELKPMRLQKN
jgi:hypothetical protein